MQEIGAKTTKVSWVKNDSGWIPEIDPCDKTLALGGLLFAPTHAPPSWLGFVNYCITKLILFPIGIK